MSRSIAAFSTAARAAGAVMALGYLMGAVRGPVVALGAALALITYGRVLPVTLADASIAAGALAVLAGGLGTAALRWETLGLDGLRGAQAVLGPTVLVGPTAAAAGAWAAAGGCVVALAAWLASPLPVRWGGRAWWAAEALIIALALVTAFWGESIPAWGSARWADVLPGVGRWAVATVAVAAAAVPLALGAARVPPLWRALVVGVAAAAVVVGSAIVQAS